MSDIKLDKISLHSRHGNARLSHEARTLSNTGKGNLEKPAGKFINKFVGYFKRLERTVTSTPSVKGKSTLVIGAKSKYNAFRPKVKGVKGILLKALNVGTSSVVRNISYKTGGLSATKNIMKPMSNTLENVTPRLVNGGLKLSKVKPSLTNTSSTRNSLYTTTNSKRNASLIAHDNAIRHTSFVL